ncbi:hypothetical protein Aduo_010464 [Ancylostoma duodenale]
MTALFVAILFVLAAANDDDSEEIDRFNDFYEYSDSFARKIMFPISAAAYALEASTIETCLRNTIGDVTGVYQFSFPCQDGECSAYVAQLPKYNAIALGFRGTQKTGQLVEQVLDALLSPWKRWVHGGRISEYFHDVFWKLWHHLDDWILAYIREHPDTDVWISGHSLGGALATLAASHLVKLKVLENPDKVKLVTFGQPRVGNKEFADAVDEEVDYAYRVVHYHDLVPTIPKAGFWHQGIEIFYTSDMKPENSHYCGRGDSIYCSSTHWSTSISDHREYFGKPVSEYGKGGCKT